MNLEAEEGLDLQLMAPTAGRGYKIPSNRNVEHPETQNGLNSNIKSTVKQPAAIPVDQNDEETQCEKLKASGSLGH